MDRVLVSYRIPNEAYEHQCQTLQFDMPDEAIMRFSPDDLKKRLEDYDALLVIGTKVDDDLMAAGKKLRVIGNMGVGYDKIDVQAASRRKIWVVNTPFSVTQPTAELTIGLMISAARKIAAKDAELRNTLTIVPQPIPRFAVSLYGKTLGIIGFGRIGRAVAVIAKALGMKIIYNDITPADDKTEQELGAVYTTRENLLMQSDVVSLHCPYFAENYHMMDTEQFALMKKGSFFINAARGKLYREDALIEALESGHLAGAALDVYEFEPRVNERLARLDNVVLTPHMGTMCYDARIAMLKEAIDGIASCLAGEWADNVVNR